MPRRRQYRPEPRDFTYFVLMRDRATGRPIVVTDLYTDRPTWRHLLRRSRFTVKRLEIGPDGPALVEYLWWGAGDGTTGEETAAT